MSPIFVGRGKKETRKGEPGKKGEGARDRRRALAGETPSPTLSRETREEEKAAKWRKEEKRKKGKIPFCFVLGEDMVLSVERGKGGKKT